MTLPTVNSTIASEPTSFSAVPQINGTILFEWTRPIVQPVGTEFQIIRSTNSANAAVGTVVWQGAAYQVPLVMPTSRHAYYVRSAANSGFSPYTPNTFGILAAARGESESAKHAHITRDWDFNLSAAFGSYWIASNSFTDAASIATVGGITGGKMVFRAAGNNNVCYATPLEPLHQNIAGLLNYSVRVRCNSAGAGVSSLAGSLQFTVHGYTGVGTPVLASNVSTTVRLQTISMPDLVNSLGLWVSINTAHLWIASIADATSYPYLVAGMFVQAGSAAVSQFELDVYRISMS